MKESEKKLLSNNEWRDKKAFSSSWARMNFSTSMDFTEVCYSVQLKNVSVSKLLSCRENSITRWTWHEIIVRLTRLKFGQIPEFRVQKNGSIQKKLNYFIDFIENGQITGDRELSKRIYRLMPKIFVRILLAIFQTHIHDTKICNFAWILRIINNQRESPRARSIANPQSNVYLHILCSLL